MKCDRKLYLRLIIILTGTLNIQAHCFACGMPEEPFFMVHPLFENIKQHGFSTKNDYFNSMFGSSWENNSTNIKIQIKNMTEEEDIRDPVKISINQGLGINRIHLVGIIKSTLNNKYYPYILAKFNLEKQNISEIRMRIKMYEVTGEFFAIGYSLNNIVYISKGAKIKNINPRCAGPIFVPSKELAIKHNEPICDKYKIGIKHWNELPACRSLKELNNL